MEKTRKILKWKVSKGKQRLDKFLAGHTDKLSRGALQRLIGQGNVLINDKIQKSKSAIVMTGDNIKILYQEPRLQAREDIILKTVFEDDDILIIDKPPGLVVHPTPNQNKPSVASGLLARLKDISDVGGDQFRPGIVHRLDADTSGLLVIAKNNQAFEYLKKLFDQREIEKEYLALAHGKIQARHGFFRDPIGRKPKTGKFQTGMGREALTEYWVEGHYEYFPPSGGGGTKGEREVDIYTLVRIQLHTGRTHQIRVHFSSAGFPVAGDKLYGGRFRHTDQALFPRQFLHASRLKLGLPSGKVKEFRSPLPEDLKKVLTQLKVFSP